MSTTPLEELGDSIVYPVDPSTAPHVELPQPTMGHTHRAYVRTISGMQKEAAIANSLTNEVWRLSSDEGDYLDGDDVAPCPLGHMAVGMVASYLDQLLAAADRRGISLADIELVLDNFYSMKGSALRGDMTAGALSPELSARVNSDADDSVVTELVTGAVDRAPVTDLMRTPLDNRFALVLDGQRLETDRVPELDGALLGDPTAVFDTFPRSGIAQSREPVHHTGRQTEEIPDGHDKYTAGEGSSLEAEQDRILHIQATGSLTDDGLYRIEQRIFSPTGSVFSFLAERDPFLGGMKGAPDAHSYLAAGIGFCFLTQFGRYAEIHRKELTSYGVVQDLNWSIDPSAVEPIETYVFLDTPEGPEFARDLLDFSEQTCFLHALCRSKVSPVVSIDTC